MARKLITAQDALREAYGHGRMTDDEARTFATHRMMASGHDGDIAEAAVIAAFNAHFKTMGAV